MQRVDRAIRQNDHDVFRKEVAAVKDMLGFDDDDMAYAEAVQALETKAPEEEELEEDATTMLSTSLSTSLDAFRSVFRGPTPRMRSLPTQLVGVSHPAKSRRIRTADDFQLHFNDEISGSISKSNHNAFARSVYDQLVTRLRAANVNVSQLTIDDLQFCLPHNMNQVEAWKRLLTYPMLTTDNTMKSMFNLHPSTKSTPSPDHGQQIFYVRSFRLTIATLTEIIKDWKTKNLDFIDIAVWQSLIEHIDDNTVEVFVRYIGTSKSVSAWARFNDDLKGRTDGIYGAFIQTLSELDTAAVQDCACYTLPSGTSNSFRSSTGVLRPLDSSQTDIKEQALIQLFGFKSLLNRQPGGIHSSYVPPPHDHAAFQKLKTKTFQKLEDVAKSGSYRKANYSERLKVNKWMRNVMELGEQYPKELGTYSVPGTSEMEAAWAQQAVPAKINEHVVLVQPLHASD